MAVDDDPEPDIDMGASRAHIGGFTNTESNGGTPAGALKYTGGFTSSEEDLNARPARHLANVEHARPGDFDPPASHVHSPGPTNMGKAPVYTGGFSSSEDDVSALPAPHARPTRMRSHTPAPQVLPRSNSALAEDEREMLLNWRGQVIQHHYHPPPPLVPDILARPAHDEDSARTVNVFGSGRVPHSVPTQLASTGRVWSGANSLDEANANIKVMSFFFALLLILTTS